MAVVDQQPLIETNGLPRQIEPLIEPVDDIGKHVTQIVNDVPQFCVDTGLVQEHFTGAPQEIERGRDGSAELDPIGLGVRCPVAGRQQIVKRTLMRQCAAPFRLGRVGGEHRLDSYIGKS